jgi:hypothetical protein
VTFKDEASIARGVALIEVLTTIADWEKDLREAFKGE